MAAVAVVMLAALSLLAGETGTVTGKVTDKATGKPLVYAVVEIEKLGIRAVADSTGVYRLENVPVGSHTLKVSFWGMTVVTEKITLGAGESRTLDFHMEQTITKIAKPEAGSELRIDCMQGPSSGDINLNSLNQPPRGSAYCVVPPTYGFPPNVDTEEYGSVCENEFRDPWKSPLSTFSIDVDPASYANARRFLNEGRLPPPDAVRVEEFLNYFDYDYAQPQGEHPFSITTEISTCPWNSGNRLVHIGLQGKDVPAHGLPASNLVFLLDVSGSMDWPDKLPLVKSALRLLVGQLRPQDRVAIVVYAGSAGLMLPSTPGNFGREILGAIDRLEAGGRTAGGAGIQLAYRIASENFLENGNNRVILATDGDFNVGVTDTEELVHMIETKRDQGIFLTVLGVGTGNLKDDRMEQLADKGNGNYAYIDNILEAQKVLVHEMGGTLFTIAKDVKIQVEFNPARVAKYRLVGYENRMLRKEDFANDAKDAGELGSGHSVAALYEIVPADVPGRADDEGLRYQRVNVMPVEYEGPEIMTVKLRYKKPNEDESRLIARPVIDEHTDIAWTSPDFRFAAAVAEFGLLLSDSRFKHDASFDRVVDLARGARGRDDNGNRAEFVRLAEVAQSLSMHIGAIED
jgi:Ca-activated chloride channel family protein